MDSLVQHLHAFVADVRLTEVEWRSGIDFLTETGRVTDEKRQEFILLSDVLGISMLVIGLNNRVSPAATASTVFGPFFVEGAPEYESGDDVANGAPGDPCIVHGRVLSTSGEAVPGASVDVWQADDEGMYDVQYEGLAEPRGRGRLRSGADGRFSFRTVRPTAYAIPTDGPVGRLLEAAGRSPMRPAHIHFRIRADGYRTLTTHVFAAGDAFLDSDAVFGVRDSLVASFDDADGEGCTLAYDFVLEPA